jgi:hypothetical protein
MSAATNGKIPGSNRTLDFGGPVLTETLVAYNGPAHTYTYKIADTAANLRVVPVRGLIAQISAVPAADGGSVATWEFLEQREGVRECGDEVEKALRCCLHSVADHLGPRQSQRRTTRPLQATANRIGSGSTFRTASSSKIAEIGSASTKATGLIGLELDLNDSYSQFDTVHHSGTGVVHTRP